jgi:required for meiotic nuclear division protein 1
MEKTVKLSAILVANQIDIKGLKSFLEIRPTSDSSTELFYRFEGDRYQYYFNYGVIVFSGHSEEEFKLAVATVQPYLKNPTSNWLRDSHKISTGIAGEMRFEFDQVIVDHLDERIFRITMLNLAQSVALDHYHEVCENLLTEIKGFTNHLEQTGRLSINRRNMLKFIGKALNTQIEIADNIYIFDAPEQVWDDEYLDGLHKGLMKHFDLRVRFSEIEYTLKIIEANLSVFREISNQRQSNMLEWIIITLIMVEIVNLFISKIF